MRVEWGMISWGCSKSTARLPILGIDFFCGDLQGTGPIVYQNKKPLATVFSLFCGVGAKVKKMEKRGKKFNILLY